MYNVKQQEDEVVHIQTLCSQEVSWWVGLFMSLLDDIVWICSLINVVILGQITKIMCSSSLPSSFFWRFINLISLLYSFGKDDQKVPRYHFLNTFHLITQNDEVSLIFLGIDCCKASTDENVRPGMLVYENKCLLHSRINEDVIIYVAKISGKTCFEVNFLDSSI